MRLPSHPVLLSLGYYPAAVILAIALIFHSAEQSRAFHDAARFSTLSSKVTALGQSVVEAVTLGFYDGGSDAVRDYQAAAARAAYHSTCVTQLAWGILGSALVFGVLLVLVARCGHPSSSYAWVQHLNWLALICFCIGICSNALSFRATMQVPLLGQVVLRHQSKGILTTTVKLLESGDWALGAILCVFSVLLPIAKVAAILFACNTKGPRRHAAIRLVKGIGKWSMLDVFVVAVLVSALTMGRDSGTEASAGLGVVFFAAYCFLSMLAAAWLGRLSDRPDGEDMTDGESDNCRMGGSTPQFNRNRLNGMSGTAAPGPVSRPSPLFGLPWK